MSDDEHASTADSETALEQRISKLKKITSHDRSQAVCDYSAMRTDLKQIYAPSGCQWMQSWTRTDLLRYLLVDTDLQRREKPLATQDQAQGRMKWIAFLGDSILRHQFFYLTDLLLQPPPIERITSVTSTSDVDRSRMDPLERKKLEYREFKRSGLVPTRYVCCALTSEKDVQVWLDNLSLNASSAVSMLPVCQWGNIPMKTGRENGKVYRSEEPLRSTMQYFWRSSYQAWDEHHHEQSPNEEVNSLIDLRTGPRSFCFTWQYVNFPDEDMREEVKSHLEEPSIVIPELMILNGGLHSLMRNQTKALYLEHVRHLVNLLETSSAPTRFVFHDITHTKQRELPSWKQHIHATRIQSWNRQLWSIFVEEEHQCHRVGSIRRFYSLTQQQLQKQRYSYVCDIRGKRGQKGRIAYIPVSQLTDHLDASNSGRSNKSPSESSFVTIDTIGDGMHLNDAFSHITSMTDLSILLYNYEGAGSRK